MAKEHKHVRRNGKLVCPNPAAHKDHRSKGQRVLLGAYMGRIAKASPKVKAEAKRIRKAKGMAQAIGFLKRVKEAKEKKAA